MRGGPIKKCYGGDGPGLARARSALPAAHMADPLAQATCWLSASHKELLAETERRGLRVRRSSAMMRTAIVQAIFREANYCPLPTTTSASVRASLRDVMQRVATIRTDAKRKATEQIVLIEVKGLRPLGGLAPP